MALFWKDKWVGKSSLSQVFPKLFRAVLDRDASVKDYYSEVNGKPHWSITFRRTLMDFEEDQLRSLESLLRESVLSMEEDRWVWAIDPGVFSVRSILRSVYS